jgi:hypothetical protein
MMRSTCTGMKEDHYTAVTRSRIIRRLRVLDLEIYKPCNPFIHCVLLLITSHSTSHIEVISAILKRKQR